MNPAFSILRFDAMTLARDNFLAVIAGITAILVAVFALAGLYRHELGIDHFQPFVRYFVLIFLVSNVATYGMMFGLIFVEEVESRVRAALMIAPVHAAYLTILRTSSVMVWLTIQPFLFTALVATLWGAVSFGIWPWLALSIALAPLGAVFMIALSTLAANRVEALAFGKFFSMLTLPPMALFLLPAQAWYNFLFLIFPTTPTIYAFNAFEAGEPLTAMLWLLWGMIYSLALIALATRRYIRHSYKVIS